MAASAPLPTEKTSRRGAAHCRVHRQDFPSRRRGRRTPTSRRWHRSRRGTRVYLSAVPNRPAEESVAAAIRLRAAGFEPVPHRGGAQFRAASRRSTKCWRGSTARPASTAFSSSPATAANADRSAAPSTPSTAGLLRRRGIRTIGIAGYPQGHPRIGDEELDRALAEKIAAAEAIGLTVEIVTQFCFEAPARSSTSSRGCVPSASIIGCASGWSVRPVSRRFSATPAAAACAPPRRRWRVAPA